MRFLFITTGSLATVYAIAPLATALRNAGHDVLLAANEPLMQYTEAVEIPAVSVVPEAIHHFMTAGRSQKAPRSSGDLREEMLDVGRGFARMAGAELDALLKLTEDWPPDVVVGGSMSYAAGLLATRLEVPYVRQAEYLRIPMAQIDPGAEEGLRSQLEHLGLNGLPEPALFIEACPPSLRFSPVPQVQPMRWIPRNGQRRLRPWMYTRPQGRPRLLITSGTHFRMVSGSSMRHLVGRLAQAGAEVLIAVPGRAAEELRTELAPELGNVHIGWLPLDVVAPTCDLAVHHGGATTSMTVMSAGVPQLVIPPNTHTKAIAQALSDFGAALTVAPPPESGLDLAEAIVAGCRDLLADPRYAQQAQALAEENAALPTPSAMVSTLEALT